jgi:thiol-disulfide isomerase/thioredoxin
MSARTARTPVRTFSIKRFLLWSTIAAVVTSVLVAVGIANRSVPPAVTDAPPFNVLSVGDPAPPISVATTQGPFTLATTSGPVFLEVFATWCPHCQRETAVINQLYDRYKGRVDFVAVSGSPYAHDRVSAQSLADVLGFAQFFNVRYPVAYDESLAVAKSYLQGGYPTIAIIGTNKRIAYIGSGEIARKTLDLEIRRQLK